jgi:hypothetical protein
MIMKMHMGPNDDVISSETETETSNGKGEDE